MMRPMGALSTQYTHTPTVVAICLAACQLLCSKLVVTDSEQPLTPNRLISINSMYVCIGIVCDDGLITVTFDCGNVCTDWQGNKVDRMALNVILNRTDLRRMTMQFGQAARKKYSALYTVRRSIERKCEGVWHMRHRDWLLRCCCCCSWMCVQVAANSVKFVCERERERERKKAYHIGVK